MFYIHVLESLSTGRHYFGCTSDLQKRLKYHNSGKVRSTKAYHPFKIIYSEEYQTKTKALRREQFFKSIDGYNWLNAAEPANKNSCPKVYLSVRQTWLYIW